jgi:cytochrome c-type biogenesis protein CcmH
MAVEPAEMLGDPVLEARARDISQGLRCPVCQNESIDESHANVAGDLRLLVRERLTAGDTNQEVFDFVVQRYGEFVLLNPPVRGSTIVLWLAGPVMLLLGLVMGWAVIRRKPVQIPELSDAEQARLREIVEK